MTNKPDIPRQTQAEIQAAMIVAARANDVTILRLKRDVEDVRSSGAFTDYEVETYDCVVRVLIRLIEDANAILRG